MLDYGKKEYGKSMFRLMKYLKGALLFAFIAPLAMFAESAMDLLQPRLMASIIDIGVANGDLAYVLNTGAKMLGAALIGFAGGAGSTVASSIAALSMGEKMRLGVFGKIQTLACPEIDRFKASSLITRLTNDVTQVQVMMRTALSGLIRGPVICFGGIVMAIALSLRMSAVFLIASPIILIAVAVILNKSFPLFAAVQERLDRLTAVMRESVLGIRVIKAFSVDGKLSERFDGANSGLADKWIKAQNMNILLWPIVTMAMNMSVIAVLWAGGNMVTRGELEIGKTMAFVNYLIQAMNSLLMMVVQFLNYSRAKVSAARINELLDAEPSIRDGGRGDVQDEVQDEVQGAAAGGAELRGYGIEFRNVTFRYGERGENALSGISVKIREGERIGVIGATGSGKSTFINLIPRLYDATEGQVLVGGADVRDIGIKELRDSIGVVPQESFLFSGTIEENLKFGNGRAGAAAMRKAAADAQAHEFISEKEGGYQSAVEQRGDNLSGGQKQRINIARALLKDAKILILDDASSALDMETEARLQAAVRKRAAGSGSTVITIAQRISGVMDADRIIVLDDGRISAAGAHSELLRSSEIYRSIAVSQLGEDQLKEGVPP
jgi:ATP-binding cassette subfamily B protein